MKNNEYYEMERSVNEYSIINSILNISYHDLQLRAAWLKEDKATSFFQSNYYGGLDFLKHYTNILKNLDRYHYLNVFYHSPFYVAQIIRMQTKYDEEDKEIILCEQYGERLFNALEQLNEELKQRDSFYDLGVMLKREKCKRLVMSKAQKELQAYFVSEDGTWEGYYKVDEHLLDSYPNMSFALGNQDLVLSYDEEFLMHFYTLLRGDDLMSLFNWKENQFQGRIRRKTNE